MSFILRCFHIASKQLAYVIIILLIMLIVSLGVVYWLSDAIEQRQDEIADWASEQLGYPVILGDAGVNWLGFTPKLRLEAVSILTKEHSNEILSFDNLYVGLDLVASVQKGEPVLNDITLTGLNIAITRSSTGNVSINGFDSLDDSSVNGNWLQWSQLLHRFNLQAITVDYSDQLLPSLSGQYQLSNAIVSHQKNNWTTTGSVQLPQRLGKHIQFQAQATINHDDVSASTWQWHSTLTDLNLALATDYFSWQGVIEQGFANATVSAYGQADSVTSVSGRLAMSKMKLVPERQDSGLSSVVIDSLSGQFDWVNQNDYWQLSGENIQINMNGDVWSETNFTLNRNNRGSWLIASKYARLSDISALASLFKSSPEALLTQRPAGEVTQFNLHYSDEHGVTGLAFSLQDGAFDAWNDIPGVTGLTMTLNWNDDEAKLEFDSHKLSIYAKKWLDKTVFFDSVMGRLNLQKTEKSWRVNSQGFRVWNDDLTLQLDGRVEQNVDGQIFNDISLKIEDFNIEHWKDYLPASVLNKDFKNWSSQAFPAGKIVDGLIEWKGVLSEFPYKQKTDDAYFRLKLQAEDVQLHYATGWPDLFGVKAEITGHGYDLIIKSQQGDVAGFDFVDVTTIITKLNEKKPVLELNGELDGTSQQALLFLQNSPLKERFGRAAKFVAMDGKSHINLELMVPLAEVDLTEVSGDVSFIDSQLKVKSESAINEGLSHIHGRLKFDNNGVYAKNIKADLFHEPVNINVKPQDNSTAISMLGHISTQKINSLWAKSVPDFIHGKTAYQVDVTVLEKSIGDFYVNYDLIADLKGIEIDMPEPLAKTKQQSRSFNATMENTNKGPVFSFKYADIVNVIAIPHKNDWQGAVRFGNEPAVLPNNGITIRGQIPELSIDDWLEWSKNKIGTDSNSLSSSIDDISMTIDTLTGFGQQLTAVNYSANKDGQGWRITMHSDQTKGNIYVPLDFNASVPLEIQLDQLVFTLPKNNEATKTKAAEDSTVELWPAMKINIGSLTMNDIDLGELALRASRELEKWKVDSASLVSPVFNAQIGKESYWQQSSFGQHSKFSVQLNSPDLAKLLESFGYQQAIDASDNQITAELSWSSHPLGFSVEGVTGRMGIHLGSGKLKDVEPGAAGRIFGLMSVAALPRRLSLDFNDLFSSGFSFNAINGDFNLADGLAVTDNFLLNSASADIGIIGTVDIVNQRYDQTVKVTPNVSSTLPLAGAVAGGPIGLGAGIALLALDKLTGKLFGKNIVNIISYTYDLTGPWDDPHLAVSVPDRPVTQKK